MNIFESKPSNIIALVISGLVFLLGLVLLFYQEYLIGIYLLGIGGVIFVLAFKKLKKRRLIIEIKNSGISLPYKGKNIFIRFDEIERAERKVLLISGGGVPDSYVLLFFKDKRKSIKIALPDLDIDEEEVVDLINQFVVNSTPTIPE